MSVNLTPTHPGKVYFVGAGIGQLDHLTIAAQSKLRLAEVLIYDALVNTHLLTLVPPNCACLPVGKRGGQPSLQQREINELIVNHCQMGKRVVRLKSGDPFIFGRCFSEIQALMDEGCAYEVVPGLSSALAAPLLAGIPLTDPQLSRCFGVITAHDLTALNWSALSGLDTLVVLMGGRNLSELVNQLLHWGRSPKTPIAIIRWAGHPQQFTWTGRLANIVAQVGTDAVAPSVIIIGDVVELRDKIMGTSDFHHTIL